MISALIIGDKLSPFNKDPNIPFVGARCFNRLLEWIKFLDLESYILTNSDREELLKQIYDSHKSTHNGLVIALGNKASARLDKLLIPHHKICHPSGRNRKINDQKYVDEMLNEAYAYIHGRKLEKSGAV